MNKQVVCLNDGFVQLIDHMGSDASICNAARVSYGNHNQEHPLTKAIKHYFPDIGSSEIEYINENFGARQISFGWDTSHRAVNWSHMDRTYDLIYDKAREIEQESKNKDRKLIRYLMRHRHTTPFEMVSFVFLVRCPIHVARQWMRHRTWSYNEYSTRYKEAIDSFETTEPDAWRTQAINNKQGSNGYLSQSVSSPDQFCSGNTLSKRESWFHTETTAIYQERLEAGVAREQARKDLPLSTYTEFYAKVDLHNLFHFLSLRMDSHAQIEIRIYAIAIAHIIKPLIPASYEAFKDYRLNGCHFSAQEMKELKEAFNKSLETTQVMKEFSYDESMSREEADLEWHSRRKQAINDLYPKPDNLSDREWKEFLQKLT